MSVHMFVLKTVRRRFVEASILNRFMCGKRTQCADSQLGAGKLPPFLGSAAIMLGEGPGIISHVARTDLLPINTESKT